MKHEMKSNTILFIVLVLLCYFGIAYAGNNNVYLAPDGTYVGGEPQLAPDGTYVGGEPTLAPDGSYVGGDPILAPDGDYVGDGSNW